MPNSRSSKIKVAMCAALQIVWFASCNTQKNTPYQSAVISGQNTIPYVAEFRQLFPTNQMGIRHYDGRAGHDPTFYMAAPLYSRYIVKAEIPVRVNDSQNTIVRYAEPVFYVVEIEEVSGRSIRYNAAFQRTIEASQWQKLVDSNGNFEALDIILLTNQPVANFMSMWERNPDAF